MSLTVKKLHPLIGAEVTGLDLRQTPAPETRAELLDAWMENLVLIFPNQPLA